MKPYSKLYLEDVLQFVVVSAGGLREWRLRRVQVVAAAAHLANGQVRRCVSFNILIKRHTLIYYEKSAGIGIKYSEGHATEGEAGLSG
jgi:hypothetical protein